MHATLSRLELIANHNICHNFRLLLQASLAFLSVFFALIFRRHVSERSNQVDPSERVWIGGGILLAAGSSCLWSVSWYSKWPRQLQWLLGIWTVVVILVLSTGRSVMRVLVVVNSVD